MRFHCASVPMLPIVGLRHSISIFLRPVLILLGLLISHLSPGQDSHKPAEHEVRMQGVLIKSEWGALSLPIFIVPEVQLKGAKLSEVCRMLETSTFGNEQWLDRSKRVEVTCSKGVAEKPIAIEERHEVTGLELLTLISRQTGCLVIVDDFSIHFQ